jgi:hypothetical protein
MLRAALLLCAMLSAGLLSGPADARDRDRDRGRQDAEEPQPEDREQDRREERREERGWLDRRESAKQAGRLAQRRNGGGTVLSVEAIGGGHRVKVLKDGVVRVYVVEDEDR